jgi:hypothetical protein
MMHTALIAVRNRGRQIFFILLSLFVVLAVSYCYLVSKSIYNVIVLEETANEIVARSTDVSELEAQYFEKKDAVSLSYARELGFVELSDTHYIPRTTQTARALSLNVE